MKLVVLDGYAENPGDLSWNMLKAEGEFVYYDRTPDDEDEIVRRIGDADIVITNKTPITRTIIDRSPSIRFIAVLATGYNVVDVDYASVKGIPVSNVPSYGTDCVAQYAVALLLELCHHIGHHSDAVHSGEWESSPDWCFWNSPQIELAGKTIGIIGFGRIGHRTGQIARALNMYVIVNDSYENPAFIDEGFEYVSKDQLFERSDVIVLHCPYIPGCGTMINKETLSKMKDGVLIINNSRGQLVDEIALADALNSGKVAGAAVDVVSSEPIHGDNPLLTAANCIITPHMSWGAKEARNRIMNITAENIRAFKNGIPQNVVNK